MQKQGGAVFKLFVLVFLSLGFFIGQKCSAVSASEVVINEVVWMGSAADANAEWLELKNTSAIEISLDGWILNAADGAPKIKLSGSIPASGYFLMERTDDNSAPGAAANLIYAGALGNSGEVLELKDSAGNLIDKIDASGGWPAGDNTAKQTMERTVGGAWQNSAVAGGTPGAANGSAAENSGQENDQTSSPTSSLTNEGATDNRSAIYGDVLINEFVSTPEDGQNEWVELYNHGGGELSLVGWTIADGSGKETFLTGGFDSSDYYFFVAEKFKGALNNEGDEIILYNNKHNMIDRVVYGKYGDQPENNAPAPGKGQSAALKIDGRKELLDKDSFALTSIPTKGKTNNISAPKNSNGTGSGDALVATEPKGAVFITEIFPNPSGSDRDGEFIELHNFSNQPVDLQGYRLEIDGGRSFEFGEFLNQARVLPPQGYFALFRQNSGLILNNEGGTIWLFASPREEKPDQVLTYDSAGEGLSFCDSLDINLATPGIFTKKFLANSLSVGEWIWNQTPTPGAPNQIKTPNHPPVAAFSVNEEITAGVAADFDASDSFDEDGDLLSFAWDFGDGVRLSLENPAHIFLRPGNFLVRLTVSDGQEKDYLEKNIEVVGVFSGGVPDSQSLFIPDEQEEIFTSLSAEKKESNEIFSSSVIKEKSLVKKVKSSQVAAAKKTVQKIAGEKIYSPAKMSNSAVSLKQYKLGVALKISGTVIVLPGVFGSQYFYALSDGDSSAVKIYSYKKDFPKLALGDLVEVSGTVGGSEIDKYLNAKVAANIKIVGQNEAPEPEKITSAGFKEENSDHFVKIEGEVTAKSGSLLAVEDGEGKFNIYLKSGANIDTKEIRAGQKITATGLLGKVSSGLAIMPRGQFDLSIASPSAENTLGLATGSPEWTLPERKNGHQSIFYFLLVIAFFAVFSIIIFWKRKK
jgi:hypothetical protein